MNEEAYLLKLKEAEKLYLETLGAFTSKFGADDPITLICQSGMGLWYLSDGSLARAETVLVAVSHSPRSLSLLRLKLEVDRSIARIWMEQQALDQVMSELRNIEGLL